MWVLNSPKNLICVGLSLFKGYTPAKKNDMTGLSNYGK